MILNGSSTGLEKHPDWTNKKIRWSASSTSLNEDIACRAIDILQWIFNKQWIGYTLIPCFFQNSRQNANCYYVACTCGCTSSLEGVKRWFETVAPSPIFFDADKRALHVLWAMTAGINAAQRSMPFKLVSGFTTINADTHSSGKFDSVTIYLSAWRTAGV